jgi:hypothetical protein
MRAIALAISLLAIAAVAGGCGGGPSDGDARLADACARQVKELNEEGGSTPTAKSTEDNLAKQHLVECAGQDMSTTDTTDETTSTEDTSGSDKGAGSDAGGKPAALDPAARDLFAKTCGSCHTLADAKTSGTFGPNLDDLKPDEGTVRTQIENGGGGMPPKLLEGDDADSVAAYVAAAAGNG